MMLSLNATRNGHKRAERFAIRTALRYRINGEMEWRQGTTENISSSGVLFRCAHSVEPDTPLELSWAMPVTAFGNGGAQVYCRGTVIRLLKDARVDDLTIVATSISHYRIIRP